MQKLITITVITAIALVFLGTLEFNRHNIVYPIDPVIFSIGNSIFTAQLDGKGKSVLASFENMKNIEILDIKNEGKDILILSHKNDGEDLFLFSRNSLKKIYSVKRREADRFNPLIWEGTFGRGSSEVFFTIVDQQENEKKRATSLYKFYIVSNQLNKIVDLPIEPTASGSLQYSPKLHSFLVNGYESADESPFIYIFDLREMKIKKLIQGFNPLWLEDGKNFLFTDHNSMINEYNLNDETKNTKFKTVPYQESSISPNRKYLLLVRESTEQEPPEMAVVSVEDGKRKKVDWKEKFGLSSNHEFPSDINWLE